MFSKRHYEAIAAAIRNTRTREELTQELIKLFKRDNPNFNEGRFRNVSSL